MSVQKKTHSPNDLFEIAGKIQKQIVKWQNSQKEMHLKQLKEHKDFEIKVQSAAGLRCSVAASINCKICNISSSLGMHDKPNSFLISNWTRHTKNCKAKQETCHDQKTLNNFLKPQVTDHSTETAIIQSESLDLPKNNNNATVEVRKDSEISSTILNKHKNSENQSNSVDDNNQQVFRLAPPIVHQQ